MNGPNTEFFLTVFTHSPACNTDWSSYTLTVTCNNNPCEISSPEILPITANEDGCLSALSTFSVTANAACVAGTFEIISDDGIGAAVDSDGIVTLPEGLAFGSYDVVIGVDDCGENQMTTTTKVVVAPVFGCQQKNVTLTSACESDISNILLNGVCGPKVDFTILIDNMETNIVSEAGVYNYQIFYTPDENTSIPLCWSTINVEDKTGPSCNLADEDQEYNFICGMETATAVPTFTDCSGVAMANEVQEMVIGNCGEIAGITNGDNNLADELFDDLVGSTPIDFMGMEIPGPTEALAAPFLDEGFALDRIIRRTFSATDGQNTGSTCEQFIYIWRPTAIVMPQTALITCGLDTSPTALATIDPQLVPHYANPLYNLNADNTEADDFSSTNIQNPLFMSTRIDDEGNQQFVAITNQSHSVCNFIVTNEDGVQTVSYTHLTLPTIYSV